MTWATLKFIYFNFLGLGIEIPTQGENRKTIFRKIFPEYISNLFDVAVKKAFVFDFALTPIRTESQIFKLENSTKALKFTYSYSPIQGSELPPGLYAIGTKREK